MEKMYFVIAIILLSMLVRLLKSLSNSKASQFRKIPGDADFELISKNKETLRIEREIEHENRYKEMEKQLKCDLENTKLNKDFYLGLINMKSHDSAIEKDENSDLWRKDPKLSYVFRDIEFYKLLPVLTKELKWFRYNKGAPGYAAEGDELRLRIHADSNEIILQIIRDIASDEIKINSLIENSWVTINESEILNACAITANEETKDSINTVGFSLLGNANLKISIYCGYEVKINTCMMAKFIEDVVSKYPIEIDESVSVNGNLYCVCPASYPFLF